MIRLQFSFLRIALSQFPKFRVPVPAPEECGRRTYSYCTLGGPLSPGAGSGIWNLGTQDCHSYLLFLGIGISESGNPGTTFLPDLLALRIRNSRACVQILDSNPFLGIWELGRWGSLGTGGRGWDSTVEPREGVGLQFRNSENGITVPLLHCRYTVANTYPHSQLAAQHAPQMLPGQARHACMHESRSSIATGW